MVTRRDIFPRISVGGADTHFHHQNFNFWRTIGWFPDYEAFIVIPSSPNSFISQVNLSLSTASGFSCYPYFSTTNNSIENVSTSTPIASLLIYRWGSGIRLEIIVLSYSSVVEWVKSTSTVHPRRCKPIDKTRQAAFAVFGWQSILEMSLRYSSR